VASLGVGATHALNLETTYLPGVALSGELLLPVGSLAASRTSYGVKLIATKSFSLARLTLNASGGTYALRTARAAPPPGCGTPGGEPCPEPPPPPPPDLPCTLIPTDAASASWPALASARCGAGSVNGGVSTAARRTQRAVDPTRSGGARWT